MSNRYSADHIVKDHLHTDITYNTEEPPQKYRLGTVSNRLLGAAKFIFTYFFILNYKTEQNRKHNGQLIFS